MSTDSETNHLLGGGNRDARSVHLPPDSRRSSEYISFPKDVRYRSDESWIKFFRDLILFDTHFTHSYVFGLTLLIIYKGYALKYESRLPLFGNILLLMTFPMLQHFRHYAGAVAISYDPTSVFYTTVFLWLTSGAVAFSVYFKSYQGYVLPYDYLLSVAELTVVCTQMALGLLLACTVLVRGRRSLHKESLGLGEVFGLLTAGGACMVGVAFLLYSELSSTLRLLP